MKNLVQNDGVYKGRRSSCFPLLVDAAFRNHRKPSTQGPSPLPLFPLFPSYSFRRRGQLLGGGVFNKTSFTPFLNFKPSKKATM